MRKSDRPARVVANKNMAWYICSKQPPISLFVQQFPFTVGRSTTPKANFLSIDNPSVGYQHFAMRIVDLSMTLVNLSRKNPIRVNGEIVATSMTLETDKGYLVQAGDVSLGLAIDKAQAEEALEGAVERYMVKTGDQLFGPFTVEELPDAYTDGRLTVQSIVWEVRDPASACPATEMMQFPEEDLKPTEEPPPPPPEEPPPPPEKRRVTAEETPPVVGETFMCPFCRTVSDIDDVLAIATSPLQLGDPVLGENEQKRFLPVNFTSNGLAIDPDGGQCTDVACPYCHMRLPRQLLEIPQVVMSVVGAAGAGKSVFLASSIWQCRAKLGELFGLNFMDLDPEANRWINAYEEKLFFQEDDTSLQQIEKTDLNSADVCRQAYLGGDNVLLPLPSFFSLKSETGDPACLTVYDSAGEHFRAGADTASSLVTLNMLGADVLFFLYDPSADPRFNAKIDRGSGTAKNYAQRQDSLLAEMAARIKRHLGNVEGGLDKPLIFGVSKADLLHRFLPLDANPYRALENGMTALDLDVVADVSAQTEKFLKMCVPEVVASAHNIANEVIFMPLSALGHNPMREGVRPCDIKPVWAEVPIVFTLARRGFVPTMGGKGTDDA